MIVKGYNVSVMQHKQSLEICYTAFNLLRVSLKAQKSLLISQSSGSSMISYIFVLFVCLCFIFKTFISWLLMHFQYIVLKDFKLWRSYLNLVCLELTSVYGATMSIQRQTTYFPLFYNDIAGSYHISTSVFEIGILYLSVYYSIPLYPN